MRNPGCVHTGRKRAHYGQPYRHFVLELRERHAEVELESFAAATRIPLGTLKRERELVTEALLRHRVALHDRLLADLVAARDHAACENQDPTHITPLFTDRAFAAQRHIDRQFWLTAAADFTRSMTLDQRQTLFRLAACRVNAACHLPHRDRLDAIRFLVDRMVPVS